MSEPLSPTPGADRYADRYGTRPARTVGTRGKVAIAVALAAAVGVTAWFAAEQTRSDPVSADVVSFHAPGPEQIDVTFQVHMPPGTTAVCTVEALAPSFAQVGTLEVPVGPSEGTTSTYSVTVRTSEEATTGVVDGCRTTD
jgi:hypothetical protein